MNSTNRHVEVIRKLPSLRKKKAKGNKKFFFINHTCSRSVIIKSFT